METNSGVERAGAMHVSTPSTLQRHSVVILNDASLQCCTNCLSSMLQPG